jgi:hypothetical protein
MSKSTPREIRKVPTEAVAKSYINHDVQHTTITKINERPTIPPRRTVGQTMKIPPRTPKRAIKTQLIAKSDVPENNKPSFRSITRMPNASPPLMPRVARPAICANSKRPRTQPRKKNARTMAVRSRSGIPVAPSVLINAAQAVGANRRISAPLQSKVRQKHTTHCSRQSNSNTNGKPPTPNSSDNHGNANHEAKYEPYHGRD